MTIVLPIGTHKTGTTAIQRFASGHRKLLRRQGLWYPLYQDFGLRPAHYAHHHLSHAVASGDAPLLKRARRFCDLVSSRRQPGETVLLGAPRRWTAIPL